MNKQPVDYNNPLGISKKEWTKVLGVNLALLLIVYTIALVCTLCGNDFFLLTTQNESLLPTFTLGPKHQANRVITLGKSVLAERQQWRVEINELENEQ